MEIELNRKIRLILIGIAVLLAVFLFFPVKIYAQTSTEQVINQQVGINEINKKFEELQKENKENEKYIELLEKINQQISFKWTPFNFYLGFLTALITIGAIIAAILIWNSQRNYRKEVENFWKERKIENKEIEEKKRDLFKKIDRMLKDTEKKITKAQKNVGEIISRKEITEKELKNLLLEIEKIKINQKEIQTFSDVAASDHPIGSGIYTSDGNRQGYCKNCKRFCLVLGEDGLCSACRNWGGTPPAI